MIHLTKLHKFNYFKFTNFIYCSYHSGKGVYGHYPPEKQVKFNLENVKQQTQNAQLYHLVNQFRTRGHLLSNLDPLQVNHKRDFNLLELDLDYFSGIKHQEVNVNGIVYGIEKENIKIEDVLNYLTKTYCETISCEFMHLVNPVERSWFAEKWESAIQKNLSDDERKNIAKTMLKSETFDRFLGTKFASVKRYGGEGAESMMIFFEELFKQSVSHGITDIIIGMPHRGRLNLLTGLLKFPPALMFQKMSGKPEFDLPNANGATGDVLSHLFTSIDLEFDQKNVHVSLLPNPSHLEAVSPVVCGKARGKAITKSLGAYGNRNERLPIIPVQVHGDGSFSGQGIVMETLSFSNVPHFSVDGSIHIIVNNQIGYTTPGMNRGRSSLYCSDLMKAFDAPIIRVNGDDPEAVVKATRIAIDYRQKFRKDIAIDLICFRKHGHNELDDPTFTNPLMYQRINSRDSIPQRYAETVLSGQVIESINKKYYSYLNDEWKAMDDYKPVNQDLKGVWFGMARAFNNKRTNWDTGLSNELLKFIGFKSVEVPPTFNLHSSLGKVLVNERKNKLMNEDAIDWSTAEALAFGSLLYQGFNVRISGQDVGRGTFSQRHAMLVDQKSEEIYIPLNKLKPDQQGFIEIANSILSEEAVLGFEYGMSIDSPNNLIIWEAQFGDFFNGAQIMFDTLLSSGETKWMLQSGIVILLPHGMDGAGPEHSSCRLERFLQMSDSKEFGFDGDNVNWSVVNPTIPSQYYHLIRRQLIRDFRKPLIVATPKILLRHPKCVSHLSEFESPSFFKPVISDPTDPLPESVQTVIFCSGKHYYTLSKEREDKNLKNYAIVRIEELCPFANNEIGYELLKYKNAKNIIWSQEEHQNMGAWNFIRSRFEKNFNCKLKYVGRGPLAAPAVGIGQVHKKEIEDILVQTFKY